MEHARTILRQRIRRRYRVRKPLKGTAERPRLSVFRTHKHIYAQVIDDASGRTLASASSMDKQIRDFLSTVPLISALRHKSMRPRHWALLSAAAPAASASSSSGRLRRPAKSD